MKKNCASYVPVMETSNGRPLTLTDGQHAEKEQVQTGITDVLTIGEEITVFHPVKRAIRTTGWAVVHADSLDAAIAYLQSNVAAVVVTEGEVLGHDWKTVVSCLRGLADAPEVVVVTCDELPLTDVLGSGAFDLVRHPFSHIDLLWSVATAWHSWMRQRERRFGADA